MLAKKAVIAREALEPAVTKEAALVRTALIETPQTLVMPRIAHLTRASRMWHAGGLVCRVTCVVSWWFVRLT